MLNAIEKYILLQLGCILLCTNTIAEETSWVERRYEVVVPQQSIGDTRNGLDLQAIASNGVVHGRKVDSNDSRVYEHYTFNKATLATEYERIFRILNRNYSGFVGNMPYGSEVSVSPSGGPIRPIPNTFAELDSVQKMNSSLTFKMLNNFKNYLFSPYIIDSYYF